MKFRLSILLLFGLCAALPAQETVRVASPIDQVTVFEDRARVDRTASVSLSAGESRVTIAELPISLDPGSVMASFRSADGGHRVVGLRLKRVVEERDLRDEVAALEDRLRELTQLDRSQRMQSAIVSKRHELLGEFSKILREAIVARSAQIRGAEATGLLNAEEWLSDELLRAEDRLAAIQIVRDDFEESHRVASDQLAQLAARRNKVSYTAVVQVVSTGGGEGTLQLSYDVADAFWRPVYEARLDESSGVVIWSSGAEVQQRTTEDWRDVELVLSTQRSSLGLAAPTLVPMRVLGRPTASRRAGVVAREAADSLDEAAPAEPAADGGLATIEGDATEARFRVPVRSSVPADGRTHRVPLLEAALPADLAYEAIPRLSPHTFRRANLENLSGAPFLPGTVRVFREGTFVGTTEIETVPAGASFRLSFGVEGRIVARRVERTDRNAPRGGSFGGGEKRTIGHEFTVKSTIPGGCTLVLLDRLPVSEVEGVKVELDRQTDFPPQVDADGICRWNLELDAGVERRVPFEYTVTVSSKVDFWVDLLDP